MPEIEDVVRDALGAQPRRGPSPDAVWADVQRRIRRRTRRRRVLVGGAAVMLLAAGGSAIALAAGGDDNAQTQVVDAGPGPSTTVGSPTTVPAPVDALNPGWAAFAPGPLTHRDGHSITGFDEGVFVWGGREGEIGPEQADGSLFDVAAGTWTSIAAAPIEGRGEHIAAWTGRELLVWGGQVNGERGSIVYLADGAAYDPAARSWRTLATAPLPPDRYEGVWTGSELVVVGGGEATVQAAAYDPRTDTWRPLAAPPIAIVRPRVLWDGSRLLVVGGERTGDGPGLRQFRVEAYDPATDEWADLGGQQIEGDRVDAAVTGDSLLVVGLDPADGAFIRDPLDGWSHVEGPGTACEDRMIDPPISLGQTPVLSLCGTWTAFDRVLGAWTVVPPPLPGGAQPVSLVRAGSRLVAGAGSPDLYVLTPYPDSLGGS